MMQLKYMINNTDEAAAKLLANWQPVPEEIRFFRASSNYVHIVKLEGQWRRFLRLSRVEERDLSTLEAELELLLYLKKQGFAAAFPVKSKNGRYIEGARDGNGSYYGLVFDRLKGRALSPAERSPEQYENWGRQLGSFHALSKDFRPATFRRSYGDYLADFKQAFQNWQEPAALAELAAVRHGLGWLNKTEDNFGLVHYDFQYDNTFWHEDEKTFYAIDFDDAHYHFFAMDIIYALEDLEDGPPEGEKCIDAFYRGYQSAFPLDAAAMEQRQLFQRYSKLMHFYRIMRSLQDSDFAEDPDWLAQLRPRLAARCEGLRKEFKNNASKH